MSREIRAGVRLNLNDQFSSKIQGAGVSLAGFGEKAAGIAGKVNQAFSGIAGTLGTIGVGIGTAALVRGGIDFQNTVTRIATEAGVFGKEVNELGRYFLRVAYDSKVSEREILAFATAAAESAVGIKDIKENMPFMADVIQGLGLSGEEAGKIFSVLVRRGADAGRLQEIFNNLAESGARLGNVNLPMFTRYLPALLEASGGNLDDVEDIFTAVNVLAEGTTNARQAILMYQSAMQDFGRTEVREAIKRYVHVDIDDKSFAEVMAVLHEFNEQHSGEGIEASAHFERAFGISNKTMQAWQLFGNHFGQVVENLGELGDTSNAIAARAGQNAGTIQGSLNRLRTAASEFAGTKLIRPIEWLAELLDNHPDGMRKAVVGLSAAIAALTGMRAFSTVVSFIGNLKTIKGGGGGIAGGFGGGAGIPVKVTNMGAGGLGGGNIAGSAGKPKSIAGKAAGLGAVAAAVTAVPRMVSEVREARQDEALTREERSRATGGAIGDAAASVSGAAAGALAGAKLGAAIGSIIPIKGTAIGGVLGAGIGAIGGHFGMEHGGRAGRAAGEMIGGAIAENRRTGAATDGDDYPAYPFAMQPHSYMLNDMGAGIGIAAKHFRDIADMEIDRRSNVATTGDDYPAYPFAMQTPSYLLNEMGAGIGIAAKHFRDIADMENDRRSNVVTTGDEYPAYPFAMQPHSYMLNEMGAGIGIAAKHFRDIAGMENDRRSNVVAIGDDYPAYPFAMQTPSYLLDETRAVQRASQPPQPLVVNGEIVLRTELVIDDKNYRLRQAVVKNDTPYPFAAGSATDARLIQ